MIQERAHLLRLRKSLTVWNSAKLSEDMLARASAIKLRKMEEEIIEEIPQYLSFSERKGMERPAEIGLFHAARISKVPYHK